jgi:hypothetical protein
VTLRLTPDSSVRVEALTRSGSISARDLPLIPARVGAREMYGTLGSGAGLLRVQTDSGDVVLRLGP